MLQIFNLVTLRMIKEIYTKIVSKYFNKPPKIINYYTLY